MAEIGEFRQELALALGIRPSPTVAEINSALKDSLKVISELKQLAVLDEERADILLVALLTLFASAMTNQMAHGLTDSGPSAPLRRWLEAALTK
ncbi:MAG: hypothetical protein AAB075_08010 [Gemmatimonadota bacterium]